ncbi:MAG TPA: trypsin-like peptidase domain-containing protein [Humisphaera sp.]
MARFAKPFAFVAVAAASAGAALVGSALVRDVNPALGEVEAARGRLVGADTGNLSTVFRDVGKVMEPSVVHIVVEKAGGAEGRPALPFREEDLRRFFPPNGGPRNLPDLPDGFGGGDDDMPPRGGVGTGSGVIMEAAGGSGFILTNNHVAGGASKITVTLNDGRVIEGGKVVGTDPKTDLAVVQIKADRLVPARWGDSEQLQQGDFVVAFGSPFGYIGSMTHGIVSALNRQAGILSAQQGYENFIQVDCPINPGNSGGPLTNLKGEVVGINTAIATRTGSFSGIGFAIPANQAKFVYNALKTQGKVVRGWLGVSISDVARDVPKAQSFGYAGDKGVLVEQAFENGPAGDKLKAGDIIVDLDGKPVADVQGLRNTIATRAPGNEVTFKVFRDGKTQEVAVKVGEQPNDLSAVAFGPATPRRGANGAARAQGRNRTETAASERFGFRLADAPDDVLKELSLKGGARVTYVDPQSATTSSAGGLRVGDVVTDVAGTPVNDAAEAEAALAKADPTKGVRLRVATEGGQRFVFVRPAAK